MLNVRKRREEEKEGKETAFLVKEKKNLKKKTTSVLIRDFPEEPESSPRGRESERTKGCRHRGEETREDLNER